MSQSRPSSERARQKKLTSVACWLFLAAILLAVLRLTSLGARTTPTLELASSPAVAIPLWPAPASPAHRLVRARLDAVDAVFLLDTGAAQTVIDQVAAERAGLLVDARPVLAAFEGGPALHPLARVGRLSIGAWLYTNFEAVVLDLSHLDAGLGSDISGILGMNVLGRRPFELDLAANELRIGRSREAFLAARLPGATDSEFALFELNGTVVAELMLEGRDAVFVIDTGAVPTTVQPELGLRNEPQARMWTRFDATGARSQMIETVRLESLALGHVQRRDFPVDLGSFNLLGADFLQGLSLFIDAEGGHGIVRSGPS